MSQAQAYDLVVVGGGVNGAGVACDAAGRGLKVLLCEAGDLACATSSASSKLIHGGLRYLEHYAFGLVREALGEREILLANAPHIVWPLRFVLPHTAASRPRWMLRAGLFLYDHLARRRRIPASQSVDLKASPLGAVLQPQIRHGFAYWDCWVDDARLVVLNARAAADRGADVRTRTRFAGARAQDGGWCVRLTDAASGDVCEVHARAIVNAAGPWTASVLGAIDGVRIDGARLPGVRLVKGSHIVVPRLVPGEDALILQNADGRVVFVLPFETDFSLIGTTDVAFDGDPRHVSIDAAEIDYLAAAVSGYLARPITRDDVVWCYAGVRPLYDDDDGKPAQEVSRDYHLDVREGPGGAMVVSVFGGKITTYRHLAEEVMGRLAPILGHAGPAWTAHAPLPGGDIADGDVTRLIARLGETYSGLPLALVMALVRRHGSETARVLGDARTVADLGAHVGHDLYAREVAYLKEREWARTPEDVLWRRTKAGLHLDAEALGRATSVLERLL